MKMRWVYDHSNWLFGVLTLAMFVAFDVPGLYLTRLWALHRLEQAYNDVVTFTQQRFPL